ncbi:hypothetical protein J5TS2_05520 [Brevibacillus halotolerans]|nr:hypothetical protein J5TS2_05520 [Brevibacillus halotolerans]
METCPYNDRDKNGAPSPITVILVYPEVITLKVTNLINLAIDVPYLCTVCHFQISVRHNV